MKVIIMSVALALGIWLMNVVRRRFQNGTKIFVFCALYLAVLTAFVTIWDVVQRRELFMTKIHGLLLNPFFYIPTGALFVWLLATALPAKQREEY
ncbi:MAG: hypothetical protein ACRC5C_09615 [Bacilli bacterium]